MLHSFSVHILIISHLFSYFPPISDYSMRRSLSLARRGLQPTAVLRQVASKRPMSSTATAKPPSPLPFNEFVIGVGALAYISYYLGKEEPKPHDDEDEEEEEEEEDAGRSAGSAFDNNLPLYTREEVAKHKARGDKIWVTYKTGVYGNAFSSSMLPSSLRFVGFCPRLDSCLLPFPPLSHMNIQ